MLFVSDLPKLIDFSLTNLLKPWTNPCQIDVQPEDGLTIWSKNVAGIIILYNLIKYKVMHDCILYILYYILAIADKLDFLCRFPWS